MTQWNHGSFLNRIHLHPAREGDVSLRLNAAKHYRCIIERPECLESLRLPLLVRNTNRLYLLYLVYNSIGSEANCFLLDNFFFFI